VNGVAEETGATVYMNKKDDQRNANGNFMLPYTLPDNGVYYDEGDVIELDSLKFEVFATPGHTPGGVTLRCEDALFTGDTLFQGSCGRTDLPGGDMNEELRSLKKICQLEGDYEVYPGHMDSSTLERERQFNYYCRMAMDM
jgi:glyoxylase-like metal-dependent hydrolase (beta-lactamase superfamily II)